MRQLFVISDKFHGHGKVLFAWNPDGTFLCTSGSNGAGCPASPRLWMLRRLAAR